MVRWYVPRDDGRRRRTAACSCVTQQPIRCPSHARRRGIPGRSASGAPGGESEARHETGIGEKWSAKHASIYGITRKQSLTESLRSIAGVEPDQITIVINTHLHFDHAGGNTSSCSDGTVRPTFPNARYLVSRAEWEHAEQPSERDQASYLPENWRPLNERGQLELKASNYEVLPGLRLETHAGHNRSMQCWRLEQQGRTLFGFADLVPMRAHVQLPWIMGYDLFPVETLAAKKKLLPQAVREGWGCLFYHEPEVALYQIVEEEGKLRTVQYEM